ncbi:YlbF family regulator [Cohnella kolymensis]|nr:YlbF family regulator [Cohnella kolymensis]
MAALMQTLPAAGQGVDEAPADMAVLLTHAFELGDWIKDSTYAAEYIFWKEQVGKNAEAQELTRQFAKAKEKFAECERFGRFHPDYNAALDEVYAIQARLDSIESVRRFKEAESSLDQLLYDITRTIADAVSETVKVSGNESSGKGCGSGGSCSCGSGGCG